MKLRDFLELARISNLPTVWSNVFLGLLAGKFVLIQTIALSRNQHPPASAEHFLDALASHFPTFIFLFFLLALAMSLIYTGGMILNDYLDRGVDAVERPGRPIPSGRISAGVALWLAVGFLALGWLGITWFERQYLWSDYAPWRASVFAGLLVLAVVVYNINHHRSALSVIVMAVCRGLIILICATVSAPPVHLSAWWVFVATSAAVLVGYTVLISVVARREVDPERGGFGGPKTVMNMIAAMPLLDAMWLVLMGLWPASLVCVACAVLTKLGHRRIAGS